MKILNDNTVRPCRHMEGLVAGLSDGSLHGFALLYARFHVGGCNQCRQALDMFGALRSRLRVLSGNVDEQLAPRLSGENKSALISRLDHMDTPYSSGDPLN